MPYFQYIIKIFWRTFDFFLELSCQKICISQKKVVPLHSKHADKSSL